MDEGSSSCRRLLDESENNTMSYESHWKSALLNAEAPTPTGLRTWNGSAAEQRFQVYRNNVMNSLVEALGQTFSVTRALVGDEFFRGMARNYVAHSPPTCPNLAKYGDGYPDFIQDYIPARSLLYLSDIARLEQAYAEVYHSADAEPLAPDAASAALSDGSDLARCRLDLHPAFQILRSSYAVGSIWAAHQGHGDLSTVNPSESENVWVLRTGLQVAVMLMSAGDCCFVEAIKYGGSLQTATSKSLREDPAFELTACLALMFREGLITGVFALPGDAE
jgi:hypothetical protein